MDRTVTAVAVVSLLALAACAADDGTGSPTDPPTAAPSGSGQRAQCAVADPEGQLILLPGSLTPSSATVLDGVDLDRSVGLEVIEQSAVAFAGRSSVQGVVLDYPPLPNADLADSLATWDTRRDLPGVRLAPGDGQHAVLVAVQLTDPAAAGHLDGVVVRYTDAGGAHERTLAQPLLVQPPDALCDVAAYDSTLDWAP
ncbi:hypothetical protein [Nocardioides dongxiaopingii]|uniref:hypothetical protein n=1 Tax=Nocardioides dongxiaopingii TaxID=2576036 RepID=UPI0010C76C00|nr:hypothetical protein [Nocardioides dongxiaopingii]